MLTPVTLDNIAKGKLERAFQEAVAEVLAAWGDGRVGKAKIAIGIEIEEDVMGGIHAITKLQVTLPPRGAGSILAADDGRLCVETTSDDPRQPGLFEGMGNVTVEFRGASNGQ